MGTEQLELDNLLALEHRGWDSLCRQQGGSFYGSIMMPEALMILVNGMVLDRATIAATLNDSPAWSSYTIDNPRCIAISATSSVLIYHATASRTSQGLPHG
ncbi:nuclear transport factor 2 family protein [Nesterenkonia aerolata]|uniref:nuclear transport factor 2 family protein n=1 Tax=Nesterenkonia aerolata TaxID=3074079 RepID=UPI0035B605A0